MEDRVLQLLADQETVESVKIAEAAGVGHQQVVGAIKSLENIHFVVSEVKEETYWKLSPEGVQYLEHGSAEYRLWQLLGEGPLPQPEVNKRMGDADAKIGMQNAMKMKHISISKDGKTVVLSRDPTATSITDTCRQALAAAHAQQPISKADEDSLKKRKLISRETLKNFIVRKGPSYSTTRAGAKMHTELTKEMLADGSWKTALFKQFNFQTLGRDPQGGTLHPLLKVRQEFREIFLELGFQEMPTQQFVETSFWNFDSLFVPQKHPARDVQDTFFISDPEKGSDPPQDYVDRIRGVHEAGYVSPWSIDESRRNVLRTHTTAVSSWVLYHLAQSAPLSPDGIRRDFRPGRYFSVDRVFRNEEMDKTHLCEFHQVEGFVIDRNLSLANMMHLLHEFFMRIGIEKLRFKPAFNPYTEPSMEIFGYHSGLAKWMEVGNSGIFRPEMLRPMGFDEDVTAIAWGLSLERPTMIKYQMNNIHDLFGHRVDLKFIRRSMIARF